MANVEMELLKVSFPAKIQKRSLTNLSLQFVLIKDKHLSFSEKSDRFGFVAASRNLGKLGTTTCDRRVRQAG